MNLSATQTSKDFCISTKNKYSAMDCHKQIPKEYLLDKNGLDKNSSPTELAFPIDMHLSLLSSICLACEKGDVN